MLRFFAALLATFALLCTLWCTAGQAAECERRQLADSVGQYVVTCEGTLPMVRTFPPRRTMVRTVVGESTLTYTRVRVGVTHVVARLGVRG